MIRIPLGLGALVAALLLAFAERAQAQVRFAATVTGAAYGSFYDGPISVDGQRVGSASVDIDPGPGVALELSVPRASSPWGVLVRSSLVRTDGSVSACEDGAGCGGGSGDASIFELTLGVTRDLRTTERLDVDALLGGTMLHASVDGSGTMIGGGTVAVDESYTNFGALLGVATTKRLRPRLSLRATLVGALVRSDTGALESDIGMATGADVELETTFTPVAMLGLGVNF